MAAKPDNLVLRHIRRLAAVRASDSQSDRELLRRYATHRDEAAFTALVGRHGPMVLAVGRRVLGNEQDAEDTFQAAFGVLAQHAARLTWQSSIGNWLYLVAYRLALRARTAAARRAGHERQLTARSAVDLSAEITLREAQTLLDEELSRLPEKYRVPIVLCCLEGKTRDEAAQQLGWSLGTFKRRLEQSRKLLHDRLSRRGLTLSAALSGLVLSEGAAAAALPAGLATATVATALRQAALRSTSLGSSAQVALLAQRLAQIGLPFKGILAAACSLLVLGAMGLGIGLVMRQSPLEDRAEARNETEPQSEPALPPGRTDAHGDPLPAGALFRLGTMRLRHKEGIASVAFAAGGKLLITGGDDRFIRTWDPATGKELRRIKGHVAACSGDGKTLVVAETDGLHFLDAATGAELARAEAEAASARPLVFCADGTAVAGATKDRIIHLWDARSGKELFRSPAQDKEIGTIGFAPDGRAVLSATGSRGEDNVIRWWDPITGRELRQLRIAGQLKEEGIRPMGFSPDGRIVALEHWAFVRRQEGAVTHCFSEYCIQVWDLVKGQELRRLDAGTDVVWAVAFAPDNRSVACQRMGGGIEAWDVATGRRLCRIKGYPEGSRPDGASTLAFTPDSKTLATAGSGGSVHLWDVSAGRELHAASGAHQAAVSCVVFSPDGRTLASAGNDHTILLWDTVSGKQRGRLDGHTGPIQALTFSRDGRTLASAAADETVRLWDVVTGKELRTLPEVRKPRSVYLNYGIRALAFAADDKTLATWAEDMMLRWWAVATGKELVAHQVRLVNGPDVWDPGTAEPPKPVPHLDDHVEAATFTADGKTAVLKSRRRVHVVEVATGRELFQFQLPSAGGAQSLSPDGRVLAVGGWDKSLHLLELITGKEILAVKVPDAVSAVAFAPDGRSVAVAAGWLEAAIHVFDADTGKEQTSFRGAGSYTGALAFRPDGVMLASGQRDTAILLWDTARTSVPRDPGKELVAADLEQLWGDLAGASASRAHLAVATLARHPVQVLPLLKQSLHPAEPAEPRHIQQLLDDLDSPKFARRQQAGQELKRLGEEAEPALRELLKRTSSAEVRRRVETLLATPPPWAVEAPEVLRSLRALRVLERVGSNEARRIVAHLATGAPLARLTRDAQAVLERLEQK